MQSKYLWACALFCLSACLSCKKDQYPTNTVAISYEESYDLARLYPELETSPYIKYDLNKGYYLISEEIEWSQTYTGVPTEFQTLTWNAIQLPSFLRGDNAGITLTGPGIFIEFQHDFPVYSHVDAIIANDNGKVEFSQSNPGSYFYQARDDSFSRDPIQNRDLKALASLFRGPFSDGKLQLPPLSLRPNTLDEEAFTRKEAYQLQIKASWMIPLTFTGEINVEGAPTYPITLDGAKLGASGNKKHRIKQNLENKYLPFDCRITPVLTMEGKDPVYLDSFILKRNEQVEYSYEFCPTEDNWKATFHYLVAPAKGLDEVFSKDYGYLRIWYTKFTANMND